MKGKIVVLLLVLVCIVSIILVYYWLQDVIIKYDLDRALSDVDDKVFTYIKIHKTS